MQRRISAYSHDTVGLGHLRRTISICRHLTDHDTNLTALVLSGSPFIQAFGSRQRVDYLKLPSARKIANGQYEARYLDMDFESLSRLRAAVIDEGLRAFSPDFLLVDKTPAGMGGELLPCLKRLERSGAKTRVILGLRDILDSPENVSREWDEEGLWDVADRFYDEIWIYGQSDVFDTVREYSFPKEIASKTHFVGYLPKYNGIVPKEEISREIGLGGRRLVVVTAGGGEDGYQLFDQYLKDIDSGAGPSNTLHYLVTGPGISPTEEADLDRRARRPDVCLTRFTNLMTSLFAAADLVVTMGGYNSITEVLSVSGRAVVVPRMYPRTEQLIRAERLAARGLVQVVLPSEFSTGRLMQVVRAELERPAVAPGETLRFDGLDGVRGRFESLSTGSWPMRRGGFKPLRVVNARQAEPS